MRSRLARALRRLVDTLQRGLFDDDGGAPVTHGVAAAPPATPPGTPEELPRHPRANRELVVAGRRIAFFFARSRRRSIGFVVGAEGLTVRAPKWVALRDVDAAVREKGAWIVAKLDAERERAGQARARRMVWRDGATVAYLGRPLTIALDPGFGIGDAVLDDEGAGDGGVPASSRLRVGLPRDAAEGRVRDAVQSWLQREARGIFEARAAHFAARLGVRVTRLTLSSASTRWGSANASGAVRLHWRLVHYPLATIDYVVVHELAHLREMNHSRRFWNVVQEVLPDYDVQRSALKQQALSTFD